MIDQNKFICRSALHTVSDSSSPVHEIKERYVPQGPSSLVSDAPGWNSHNVSLLPTSNSETSASTSTRDDAMARDVGPICWKCKGSGKVWDKSMNMGRNLKKQEKSTLSRKRNRDLNIAASYVISVSNSPSKSSSKNFKDCPICHGNGSLHPKRKELFSNSLPGMITYKRSCNSDWKPFGPVAHAVLKMEEFFEDKNQVSEDPAGDRNTRNTTLGSKIKYRNLKELAYHLLYQANNNGDKGTSGNGAGISIPSIETNNKKSKDSCPSWLPIHSSEQLCNLVGSWRILQRVGSHRWTTDDFVTAYVARNEILRRKCSSSSENINQTVLLPLHIPKPIKEEKTKLKYLDLGCGNGSVLQMVSWSLMECFELDALGIEARSEAVSLAKRSLSFNVGYLSQEGVHHGTNNSKVSVIHGDFRDLFNDKITQQEENEISHCHSLERIRATKFDLITGTPPYFQVDFSTKDTLPTSKTNQHTPSLLKTTRIVTAAIINQGGMPTSKQSAPARCEFRGGIEAYCLAASTVLADTGIFVVCENWINHSRVFEAANQAGLKILRILPVKGKVSRNQNLFGIYVMHKEFVHKFSKQNNPVEPSPTILDPLPVRNDNGQWTSSYASALESMSIPAFSKNLKESLYKEH